MRDGYDLAIIGKIARAAGVSTRTIYERYDNKADLMVASVSRMLG
ncbi:MAG: TetR family transcriptional regulator [Methylophilaceae bacterium]|nr:TetR family transcriptional regulator [Methylophilaceae bacterium]